MNKSLVVYYTWSGHTKRMAELIASKTNADILELKPELPYSNNYNTVVDQAKMEIRKGYMPPLQKFNIDLNVYNVIFVGTPNWWSTMAPPLATFLSQNNFNSKIIVPFASHGGGGKGHIEKNIISLCPNSKVLGIWAAYEGGNSGTDKEIHEWLRENSL